MGGRVGRSGRLGELLGAGPRRRRRGRRGRLLPCHWRPARAQPAEAEQAGRDAELAQGCEATEAAPASTSPGEVATRPGRNCEPRNPSTGSLRQQVVEKCCPKCGPFKRTYDRLAVGSIVASLRLNGPMGGKRRHLLRGKELWVYLCRRHDHHMCSSEIHNVIRRDTRHVVSQGKWNISRPAVPGENLPSYTPTPCWTGSEG